MEYPPDFRCPISMKVMEDPVTISTGVTYERKNIETWFYTYKKKTCPATMQRIETFDVTPNHNLKRLIQSWQNKIPHQPSSSSSIPGYQTEITALLDTMESSPFKVTSLKKIRSMLELDDEVKTSFIQFGGLDVLVQIIVQILVDSFDFITFRACEEAIGVLHQLPFSEHDKTAEVLSKPELISSLAAMLQRGSAEARLHTIIIFQKMAKHQAMVNLFLQDQGSDLFKSLLELVSDEIWTKASSCALEVLIEILNASKKSRLKAIEAGAICVLIELLPESSRSKCERILVLLKLLCECADGRSALVDHSMGIAAISKKMLHVSNASTKLGVKILWLISTCHPSEKVLEEMLVYGAVKRLLALLHLEGRSSTKDKVIKMFKLHGNAWKGYPCFPNELKDYLGMVEKA